MESENLGFPLDEADMRLESDIMKLRLSAEYGAIFPETTPDGTDAEEEYNFLKRVLQLHQRIADTPPRPLREVLDFEQFAPVDSFANALDLHHALCDALDYLEDANVIVNFDYDYPDDVQYEFITKELGALEVIGKPVNDEYICVLYEAFHPNDEAEAESIATEFLEAFFSLEIRPSLKLFFSERLLPHRLREKTEQGLLRFIQDFHDCFESVLLLEFDAEDTDIVTTKDESGPDGDDAVVFGSLRYEVGLSDGSRQEIEGPFHVQLLKMCCRWYVADFHFFGLVWPEQGSDAGAGQRCG